MTVLTVSLEDFRAALAAQGLGVRHVAVRCPICDTVQTPQDLIDASAGRDYASVRRYFAYSCIGRWTGAGNHRRGWPPGRGCMWTLGGTLPIHTYEVVTPSGDVYPTFEPATPAEAQAHHARRQKTGSGLVLPAKRLAHALPRVSPHTRSPAPPALATLPASPRE